MRGHTKGMPAQSAPLTRTATAARLIAAGLAAPLLLAGCHPAGYTGDASSEAADDAATAASESAAAADGALDEATVKKSIIRAEVDTGPTEAPLIEPRQITVPMPEKGAKPDAAGVAMIDQLLAGAAIQSGGPVTIWGHSDSQGSDAQNLAASRRRAEAVRDYMVSKGIARSRFTVVPLGESRPIAPNRKLDGSDDLEGRTKNRRVEIRADLPPPPAADVEAAKPAVN